jgi:hypothetical protein
LFIDSDAYFNTEISIDRLLKTYGVDTENTASLFVPSNTPFRDYRANTGLHIWKRTPRALALIEKWWNMDTHALEHAYEQDGFEKLLDMHGSELAQDIHILKDMRVLGTGGYSPVTHIGTNQARSRIAVMTSQLMQDGTSTKCGYCELQAPRSALQEITNVAFMLGSSSCPVVRTKRFDAIAEDPFQKRGNAA